jgi:hypothetical protein
MANDKRYRRDRANADDAATIRAVLHRVGAIDGWERKRLDQAAAHVRADAIHRRARYFAEMQAAADRMRERGQTLAAIASLVDVDVREIRGALRRGRTGDDAGRGSVSTPGGLPTTDTADRRASGGDGAGNYDPSRCIRCDAAMLDTDDGPRRGRRRLYCSDACRRDASAARRAAERYGSPIRVVEVPRSGSFVEAAENAVPPTAAAVTPLDAAALILHNDEALQGLLAKLTEQARLKKLDRATLTAARELSKAVHPHRSW